MNNIRTVSDTKRTFYSLHTRPINSIYRRVVEELMVEMHLVSVNVDFQYHPIYALGVVTTFDKFMQGYFPESDRDSIFQALIRAQDADPQQYRQDAEKITALVTQLPSQEVLSLMSQASEFGAGGELLDYFRAITTNPKLKYSRLFAIGLLTLLEKAAPELVQEDSQRLTTLQKACEGLKLPLDKVAKDLDLYRSNLEKMSQAQIMMAELVEAERKKREQRAAEKGAVSAPDSDPS